MLKAPISLIIVFSFHIKAAGRIKNLGYPESSCKTRTSSCRCVPHHHHHQAGSSYSLFTDGEKHVRLCYSFSLFPPWKNWVILTCLPRDKPNAWLISKYFINVCWMNEGWMEGKGSEFVTPANTKKHFQPRFQQSPFESKTVLYQKPTNKGYIDYQSNNLVCWYKNQINTDIPDTPI